MFSKYLLAATLALLMGLAIGCSTGGTVAPAENPSPDSIGQMHQDWGSFALKFNPDSGEIGIDYGRETASHMDVSAYLTPPACGGSGCVSATLMAWDAVNSIASFNVTIKNPTPWAASDVRMIFYNLGGKDITNPDSYIKSFVPTISPFIAFAKANLNRVFPGNAAVTEKINIYWPAGSSFYIYFKVSAWLWLNCKDPYEINNMFQNGKLTPFGGNATIGCDVLDWQNDVTGAMIDTTPITGGVTNLAHGAGNTWSAAIANSTGAGVGTYKCLIGATSPNPQKFILYNYLYIVIAAPGWNNDLNWQLPPGPCTLDFGIIGAGPMQGHALVAQADPTGACNQIWRYPGWNNPPVFYASLVNLDPTNPLFQPWPPLRLDAANDGAFGWTNYNSQWWLQTPFITNSNTYCNMDNIPSFIWNPQLDDHRHYFIFPGAFALQAIECCDTFENYQCALYADLQGGLLGFQGLPGAPQGFDYTDQDMTWEAAFPAVFIGNGPGRVDPADVVGIDAMLSNTMPGVIILFIAERVNAQVEVYTITDVGPGVVDIVAPLLTIFTFNQDGIIIQPIDCELLPANNIFLPDPNQPILCVLYDNAQFPFPPPGFGGNVVIYDANTGAYVDQIGNALQPAVFNPPQFLDTDDKGEAVHVMQLGPVVSVFKYY